MLDPASIGFRGFHLVLRGKTADRRALGLVIKLRRDKMFSERNGAWRGFDFGPLYFRTYRRRAA